MFRCLSDIVHKDAKQFAIYTVEDRAIPNMVDGLKPVQRFVLYNALRKGKGDYKKFRKVADLGGSVAELGYHHGETNAQDAGALMASTWNNNLSILEGDGSFGSRLVKKAGAARYVFARIHENFFKIFKDFDCCPKHKDNEHIPPAFYLPIIPMVLVNGVEGIATGYATDILPHDPSDVVECTKLALEGKLDRDPVVKFPSFYGDVLERDDDKRGVVVRGTYEMTGKTKMVITEIPLKYDREKYIDVLDDLQDKDKIVSYNDRCRDGKARFEITLKRDYANKATPELIIKDFKLEQKISENIVVIDDKGLVRTYESSKDLINDFVKIRLGYIDQRIELMKEKTRVAMGNASVKVLFIRKVISGEIVLQGKKRAEAKKEIETFPELKEHVDLLLAMPLYSITTDEMEKLQKEVDKLAKEHDHWLKTNSTKEYKKDLKECVI